jgi:hypothetical protein
MIHNAFNLFSEKVHRRLLFSQTVDILLTSSYGHFEPPLSEKLMVSRKVIPRRKASRLSDRPPINHFYEAKAFLLSISVEVKSDYRGKWLP